MIEREVEFDVCELKSDRRKSIKSDHRKSLKPDWRKSLGKQIKAETVCASQFGDPSYSHDV